MRPAVGDLISGKYRLVRLIGDGGMGSVFEARHEFLGTNVALKFIHPEITQRPGLVARFLREARLSASIKSVHIARVTDVDQSTDGAAYLVMELLEGKSLHQILDEEHALSQDVALDYTMQILAGLDAAHAAGVVHRDLKPDNVFVVQVPHGSVVKLLDFGIAKLKRPDDPKEGGLTRPGMMMGTPEYMAPEQAFSADTVDARADIYSVGTMLYEMLSGRRPASGSSPQEIAAMVLGNQVPYLRSVAPAVPDTLAQIIHRAMAPSPTDRWGSVDELRTALAPFCGVMSVAGRLAATPVASAVASAVRGPSALERAPTQAAAAQPPQPAYVAAPSQQAYVATPQQPMYIATPGAGSVPFAAASVARAPRARSPRGFSFVLFALLAVAAVGILVFAIVALQEDSGRRPAPLDAGAPTVAPTAAATAAVTTAATGAATIAPPVQPVATAPPKPASTSKPASRPATEQDAGATAPTAFPLPFPLPSALPTAWPTALPVLLPSSFPISLPGLTPPPAASK